MRFAIAFALLAGCVQQSYPDPGPTQDPGWGTGPGGTGGDTSYACHSDADCGGGDACARDGECLSPSVVRTIHVTWTVYGKAASDQSCTRVPSLDLTFINPNGDQFGFSPVPCIEGKFTVDKMPSNYQTVNIAQTGNYTQFVASGYFDTDGVAVLDLRY
jgi:hypothetical protein